MRRGVPGGCLVLPRGPRRYRRDHRGAPEGRPRGRTPAPMSGALERVFIDGAAGRIETVIDRPEAAPRGAAGGAHPHPPYRGGPPEQRGPTLPPTILPNSLQLRRAHLPRVR